MLGKPLLIATLTAAVGLATISQQASAGDPVLGALIGGYYGGGYAPAYYAPAPLYAAPVVVYGSGYSYPRHVRYEHFYARRDWHGYDHRR
jgi:ABC-type multidrug transport system permease subunit